MNIVFLVLSLMAFLRYLILRDSYINNGSSSIKMGLAILSLILIVPLLTFGIYW